jgi:hypothetical protein
MKLYVVLAAVIAVTVLFFNLFIAPEIVGSFLTENAEGWYTSLSDDGQMITQWIGKLLLPLLAIAPIGVIAYVDAWKRKNGVQAQF